MDRLWGVGAVIRGLYKYSKQKDEHRLGCDSWSPKNGDLCLCVRWSGDFFYTYIVLRKSKDNTYKKAGEFGAYCFGVRLTILAEREFYLAQAGESIIINTSKGKK